MFGVVEISQGPQSKISDDPRFFQCFPSRGLSLGFSSDRPPLWNNPLPTASRGNQHDPQKALL